MGGVLACCCPQAESGESSDERSSGGHDVDRDTAPLIRDAGRGHGHGRGNAHQPTGDAMSSSFGSGKDSSQSASLNGRGDAAIDLAAEGGNVTIGATPNAEQAALEEILQESANQIIDCTASFGPENTAGATSGKINSRMSHANMNGVGTSALNTSTSSTHSAVAVGDSSEMMERANEYSKRLSVVASALVQKHLRKDDLRSSLADAAAAGGAGHAHQLQQQPAEDVLSDSDHFLVSEVASRAMEAVAEVPSVQAAPDIVVAFGTTTQANHHFTMNNIA